MSPIPGYDQWKTAEPDLPVLPCQCCGKHPDDCICPECPKCGQFGDPKCYKEQEHGLMYSAEQVEGLLHMRKVIEEDHVDEVAGIFTERLHEFLSAHKIPVKHAENPEELPETDGPWDEVKWAKNVVKNVQGMFKPNVSSLLDDDNEQEQCARCHKPVVFEKKSEDEPPEYDVCNDCQAHLCPDCVKIDNETPLCNRCYYHKYGC